MPTSVALALSAVAMVLLTFLVGVRLLWVRSAEMREKRIHPQAAATSVQMAAKLQNVQAADNFRNLFETPVLFYALVASAMAAQYTPYWLVAGAWLYVLSRVTHSVIHCTYNRVMHRFGAFAIGFCLLVGLWLSFGVTLVPRNAA